MLIYNAWMSKAMELEEGEEFCPECDGQGMIYDVVNAALRSRSMCKKCQGDGKFDWIEKIMGKPAHVGSWSSSSSSASWSSTDFSKNHEKHRQIKMIRKANERLIARRSNMSKVQGNRSPFRQRLPRTRSRM